MASIDKTIEKSAKKIEEAVHLKKKVKNKEGNYNLIYALSLVLILLVAYNQIQISGISAKAYALNSGSNSASSANTAAGNVALLSAEDVTPKGVPAVYGAELGVSYDDVSASTLQKADATIKILGNLDNSIDYSSLTVEQQTRYLDIGMNIACEYCCGATSLIFKNGQAACGCAHSYAMRGLAKYLLAKHESEFTNDQILEELGKWKVLFFPGVHAQKAAVLKSNGIELNYINLASNKYRGIEKGQTGGSSMVGGC